jgi:gliding motility-associated-like protein
MKKILFVFGVLISQFVSSQIAVTYVTADQAVQSLLGPGVTYSNAVFNGLPSQLGQMTGNTNVNFQITEGIVIGCSDAQEIVPNFFGTFLTPNIAGDPDLLAVANSVPPLIGQFFTVGSVNNIASLEFDFVAVGDSLNFNYIFGSDEYLQYVNSQYNDVFAFFLSGPGITGPYASPAAFPGGSVNIAIVPESAPPLPITISSVNNVINAPYYIDNGANSIPIGLNGFTVKLAAQYDLTCGETYHIRLAIANGSDQALKSDVIIEAGSFTTGTDNAGISSSVVNPAPNLPPNSVLEGCVNGQITFNFPDCLAQGDTVNLIFGGTATYLEDYHTNGVTQFVVADTAFVIDIIPILDNIIEETETIVISCSYLCEGACDSVSISATLDLLDYVGFAALPTDDFLICPGTTQTVNPGGSGGWPPYIYSWSNGQNSATQTFSQGSAGPYSYSFTDYCGAIFTDEFVITEPPAFGFATTQDLCAGIVSEVLVNGGFEPYSFQYNEWSMELDSLNYTISGFANDSSTVIVTDACGQSGVIPFVIKVCDTEAINIFTPDGDGINEGFIIKGIESFPNSELQVYSRWGTLVFESLNYSNQNPWDGKNVEDGVYFWILNRSDGVKPSPSGYVQVIHD